MQKKIYVSRHVTFHENTFPFQTILTTSKQPNYPPSHFTSSSKLVVFLPSPLVTHQSPNVSTSSHIPFSNSIPSSPVATPTDSSSSSPLYTITCQPQAQPITLVNTHPMVTRSKVGTFKHKAFLTKVTILFDSAPVNIHKAILSPYWRDAVQHELHALLRNSTWSL